VYNEAVLGSYGPPVAVSHRSLQPSPMTERASAALPGQVLQQRLPRSRHEHYRVLVTRGMKGCRVHFLDAATRDYVRSRLE
jgi:hypothetical protein